MKIMNNIDRLAWNKKDLENSRYVWLPFSFEGDKITIPWRDKWRAREMICLS